MSAKVNRSISAVRNTCFAILSAVESDLREILIDAALKSGQVELLPADVRANALQRFAQDNRERPGASPENDLDLVPYTDFADLAKMLHQRATELSEDLKVDISLLASQIERMAQARNRVCHSRPLEEEDLPQFLDLAKSLLTKYASLSWKELTSVRENTARDPSFVLRLEIPNFWRAAVRHN
jgi:LuxR family glucitol operon transcriptional activator